MKYSLGACCQCILQLAFFIHFSAYVNTANKVALDIQLRESWPPTELFEALTYLFILIDVEIAEGRDDCADVAIQECDHFCAELALRALRIALHKEHDRVLVDEFGETLLKGLPDAVSGDSRC